MLCILGVVALFPAILFAADAVPAPASVTPPAEPSTNVNGYFSARYMYRTASSSEGRIDDQDFFGDLRLDITRPKKNDYEFHFLGSIRSDIDGNQDQTTFYPLENVWDTFESRMVGKVYEAYVAANWTPGGYDTRVRAGRQAGTRDEPVSFDGVSVDVGKERWNVTLYGGAAIHFFEVNTHWGDDTLEGVGIDYRLFQATGVSADYLAVKDKRTFTPAEDTVHDRMVSLKLWQRFDPFTRITAKYRLLDGDPRDLSIKLVAATQATDIEASLNYFRQFRTQYELSNELSLFYDVVGQSDPYQSFDIKVRKFFAERVALDLGYYKRDLLDEADEGAFNKDYHRVFIDVEVMDLFLNNLSGTLLLEQWDSQGRSYDAVGADLSYKIKKNKKEAKVSIGTNYSLYKYDYYVEQGVREQVRTYYLNAKYPLNHGLSVNGAYEYEHSFENYQTLRLGMRYDF